MNNQYDVKKVKEIFSKVVPKIMVTKQEAKITKDRKLAVKIIPTKQKKRILGSLKNKKYFIPEDFNTPLKEINELFYKA